MKNTLKIILVLCCIAGCSVLIAMKVLPSGNVAGSTAPATLMHNSDLWNAKLVDSAISRLHSGCIVLRMGLGADSHLLAQLNSRDKSYSHCGIVMMEHGYPFVYHSIGGEDNPDERLRRDSASRFFSPRSNTAIAAIQYGLTDADVSRLQKVVGQYYRQRPRFDLSFDLKTDDRLYCSEFVYKALNKAMADTTFIGTTSLMGNVFVGIDNLFINPHAGFIFQMKFK